MKSPQNQPGREMTPTLTPSHICGQPARLAKPPQMAESVRPNRLNCLLEASGFAPPSPPPKEIIIYFTLRLESHRITLILNTNLGWAFGGECGLSISWAHSLPNYQGIIQSIYLISYKQFFSSLSSLSISSPLLKRLCRFFLCRNQIPYILYLI